MSVVAVFEHAPGIDGMTESYIIGDVIGVLTNLAWGEKKLGKFKEIVPAWDGCPTDPYLILVWSHSLKSAAARAKAARDTLKALLPKRLRRLVTLARRTYRQRKELMLAMGEQTTKTKCDLFFERRVNDADRRELAQYFDLPFFWQAATGAVPHTVIAAHLKLPALFSPSASD